MANHKKHDHEPEAPVDAEDEISPDDLRAQLKAARSRNAALEGAMKRAQGGPGRLTHHQDIERMFRLGMLSPEDVEYFKASGQLAGVPGAE